MVWGWFGEAGCGCSSEMQSLSPQPQSSLYSATSLPSCPGLPTFITPFWQPWESPNSTVASGGAVSGSVGPGRCRGHGGPGLCLWCLEGKGKPPERNLPTCGLRQGPDPGGTPRVRSSAKPVV